MDYKEKYEKWMNDPYFGNEVKEELKKIKDEEEIKDRFYKDLEFGTAGLRGIIGYGTNRMNIFTVAKATEGISRYIKEDTDQDKVAVISYDGRIKSKEFATIAARVFAANGIKTYIYDDVRPTPQESFTVRRLKADTGVMITASHNPPEYNGYKAYGSDGAQYSTTESKKIMEKFNEIKSFNEIKIISEKEARDKQLILDVPKFVDSEYIDKVLSLKLREDIDKTIKIVYTPLHGVGKRKVIEVLEKRNFKNISIVEEQSEPDGNFPTVDYPNPEDLKAFELSVNLAKKVNADIIIATDPDTDRVAALIKYGGNYERLSGNEMGYLLMDYILKQKKKLNLIPKKGVIVKTIVSSKFAEYIAKDYDIEVRDSYTGFKNIAKVIREMEEKNDGNYIFGYEESIGYLPETFVRDKDAVSTTMLIVEMTAAYKQDGINLIDRLEQLFKKYGYFEEKLYSVVMKGISGKEKIERLMKIFREDYPKEINGIKLIEYRDYLIQKGYIRDKVYDLKFDEKENAVKYIFEDDSWYVVRPSGTEPKIKIYIYSTKENKKDAQKRIEEISYTINQIIENIDKE